MAANKLAFLINAFLTIAIIAAWTGFFVWPRGMIIKVNWLYTLEAGLFDVRTSQGIISMAIGAAVDAHSDRKWGAAFRAIQHRDWEFSEWREFICQIPRIPGYEDHCVIWSNIQMGNYIMITLVPLGLILALVGAISMYYYNYVQASRSVRRAASVCYQVSFVLIAIACTTYGFFVQYVTDQYPRTVANPLGYCGMLSICVSCISILPAIICALCTGESDEELLRDIAREQKHFKRQEKNENQRLADEMQQESAYSAGGYGAAPLAPASMPMGMGGGAIYMQQPMGGVYYQQQQQQQQQQPQW